MPDPASALARAKGYPYPRPARSFVFEGGRARDPAPGEIERLAVGRTAVLAYGSNASPEQLRRKYPDVPDGFRIPTVRAEMADLDVVYAAGITSYGSVSATIARSPGTRVEMFVQFFTDAQLARMDETEGAHRLEEFPAVGLFPEVGPVPDRLHVYGHPALTLDGTPVALAEIQATGRGYPALTQAEILDRVRRLLTDEADLDRFILSVLESEALRLEFNRRLRA